MEGMMGGLPAGQQQQQPPVQHQTEQPPPPKVVEKLNPAVMQQLNLDSVKTRAVGLFKTISRILQEFDVMARSNAVPKWQDVLGQFSMVNLELYNIVEDIKKTSRAFVVHPRNVNAENATILPVMLSSKLLPEMEMDDNSKRDQLLHGLQNLPVPAQIEKLKARIDMIAAACESAEKVLADCRKAYGLDTRQRMNTLPTIDKAMAAKIQEQENHLRASVNHGEGLRLPPDQRQLTSSLPAHLADVLSHGGQAFTPDTSGVYMKNTPPIASGNISNQGTPVQASGAQLLVRSAPSPSTGAQTSSSFDNPSPLQYANSPRSGVNMMNAPSPQQQAQHQHQQQMQQQQQRQKLMQQGPHHPQLIAQQQLRQSSMSGMGQQNQMPQLSDLQQNQQKFQALQGQQMQYSQSLASQQFQGRQLPTGHLQHNIGQSQLGQASQLNRHMGQFSGPANSALFSAAQNVSNTSMVQNMPTSMPSQQLLPRTQYGLSGGNQQRTHASQMLGDQMFNMGAGNANNMMPIQQQQQAQQQQASQGAFGSMPQNTQNLQTQNHPNYQQQRQQQNPQ